MTAWQLSKHLSSRRGNGVVLLLLFDVLMAVLAVASGLLVLLTAPVVVVNAIVIRSLVNSQRP